MAALDSQPEQFEFKPSVHRSGQINFGLVPFYPPRRPSWKPTPEMQQSQPRSWETSTPSDCYPNPRWIQSEQELKDLFYWLELEDEFCIHVRACAYNAVVPYVTLIQIATWQKGNYLIDAMPLRDAIERICKPALENPRVLKIMCDSLRQVLALQRDYSIYTYGIADLLELVKPYNPAVFSYHNLIKEYDPAQYALEVFPSSDLFFTKSSHDKHIQYVTHQVHFVLRLFNKLRFEAQEKELALCFDRSGAICENFIPNPCKESTRVSPLVATSNLVKNFTMHKKVWTAILKKEYFEENKRKIVAVVEFREMLSKAMNISPQKLMSDRKLLRVCLTEDTTRPSIIETVAMLQYFKGSQQDYLVNLLCSPTPDAVMAELREIKCENCLTTGHGSTEVCIFPTPPVLRSFQEYIDFPENRELKKVYDCQVKLFLDRQQVREQETKQALQQLHAFKW